MVEIDKVGVFVFLFIAASGVMGGLIVFGSYFIDSPSYSNVMQALNSGQSLKLPVTQVSPRYFWLYDRYAEKSGRIVAFYKKGDQYCLDTWIDANTIKNLDCKSNFKDYLRYYPKSDEELDELLLWDKFYSTQKPLTK